MNTALTGARAVIVTSNSPDLATVKSCLFAAPTASVPEKFSTLFFEGLTGPPQAAVKRHARHSVAANRREHMVSFRKAAP